MAVQIAEAEVRANVPAALDLFLLNVGRYPTTDEGLAALVEEPTGVNNWNGPYLKKKTVPKDPWGNDFIYLSPGLQGDFDIISYGADGVPGGEDENKDINNWEME